MGPRPTSSEWGIRAALTCNIMGRGTPTSWEIMLLIFCFVIQLMKMHVRVKFSVSYPMNLVSSAPVNAPPTQLFFDMLHIPSLICGMQTLQDSWQVHVYIHTSRCACLEMYVYTHTYVYIQNYKKIIHKMYLCAFHHPITGCVSKFACPQRGHHFRPPA